LIKPHVFRVVHGKGELLEGGEVTRYRGMNFHTCNIKSKKNICQWCGELTDNERFCTTGHMWKHRKKVKRYAKNVT